MKNTKSVLIPNLLMGFFLCKICVSTQAAMTAIRQRPARIQIAISSLRGAIGTRFLGSDQPRQPTTTILSPQEGTPSEPVARETPTSALERLQGVKETLGDTDDDMKGAVLSTIFDGAIQSFDEALAPHDFARTFGLDERQRNMLSWHDRRTILSALSILPGRADGSALAQEFLHSGPASVGGPGFLGFVRPGSSELKILSASGSDHTVKLASPEVISLNSLLLVNPVIGPEIVVNRRERIPVIPPTKGLLRNWLKLMRHDFKDFGYGMSDQGMILFLGLSVATLGLLPLGLYTAAAIGDFKTALRLNKYRIKRQEPTS